LTEKPNDKGAIGSGVREQDCGLDPKLLPKTDQFIPASLARSVEALQVHENRCGTLVSGSEKVSH